jgi:hypothetical protein
MHCSWSCSSFAAAVFLFVIAPYQSYSSIAGVRRLSLLLVVAVYASNLVNCPFQVVFQLVQVFGRFYYSGENQRCVKADLEVLSG